MKFNQHVYLIIGLLALVSFQNCGRFGVVSNDQRIDENKMSASEIDDNILKAFSTPGDGRSPAFTGQIGPYLWGGQLADNVSDGKPLLNSAKMIGSVGFPTLRLAIGEKADYGLNLTPAESPKSLEEWLRLDQLRETLLNPAFPVVALTATDITLHGRVTHLASLKDPIIVGALYKEYVDFYAGLFALPVKEKKTFLISNWEGDNQIFYCAGIAANGRKESWINDCDRQIREDLGQSLNDSIDGFIRWNLIRKAALMAARTRIPENHLIDIKFAIEFSQIHMISRSLSRSVIWDVVPEVKPDLVLYSAYESVEKQSLAADLNEVRQFLDSKGLRNTQIGIGEIGTTGSVDRQQTVLRNSLNQLATGFPDLAIGFIWNAFNTKPAHDNGMESMGLWFRDGNLHVAPVGGLLVPRPEPIQDPEETCFTRPQRPDCEFSLAGLFPGHALGKESGLLKCSSGALLAEVGVRYDTARLVTVTLPAAARGLDCQLRVRSDLGIPGAWSNVFKAGKPAIPKTPSPISTAGYDIILIGGQSNSSSGGIGAFNDPLAGLFDDRIDQLSCGDLDGNYFLDDGESGEVVNKTDDLYDCQLGNPTKGAFIRQTNRKSFGVSLARQYAAKRLSPNRKVLLVAGGVPGSGSNQWLPGQQPFYFDSLMKRARIALKLPGQNRIVAFAWSQGESDIFDPAGPSWRADEFLDEYMARLSTIVTTARTTLATPDMPFLMTEKAERWVFDPQTKLRYQDADRRVASLLPPASVISTTGLPSNPVECVGSSPCEPEGKFIHFSNQGLVDLGARIFQEFLRIAPAK